MASTATFCALVLALAASAAALDTCESNSCAKQIVVEPLTGNSLEISHNPASCSLISYSFLVLAPMSFQALLAPLCTA
jgi:hypothetical protein